MPTPYTNTLEHHGLVAGFFHDIRFADIIDKALGGSSSERHVSCGQLLTAMVLNGPCFTGRTLNIYNEYFKDKPLDRFIGECVLPEHINDDAHGGVWAPYMNMVSPNYISSWARQLSRSWAYKHRPCIVIQLASIMMVKKPKRVSLIIFVSPKTIHATIGPSQIKSY